jgi:hypothetical protein
MSRICVFVLFLVVAGGAATVVVAGGGAAVVGGGAAVAGSFVCATLVFAVPVPAGGVGGVCGAVGGGATVWVAAGAPPAAVAVLVGATGAVAAVEAASVGVDVGDSPGGAADGRGALVECCDRWDIARAPPPIKITAVASAPITKNSLLIGFSAGGISDAADDIDVRCEDERRSGGLTAVCETIDPDGTDGSEARA